jgi:hypothetical protein
MTKRLIPYLTICLSISYAASISEAEKIEAIYTKLEHRPGKERKLIMQLEKKYDTKKAIRIQNIKKYEPNEETEALISVYAPIGKYQLIFVEFHSESGDWSSEAEFLLDSDRVVRLGHYYAFFNGCDTGAKVRRVNYYDQTSNLIDKKLTITDLKNKNLPLNSCKAMRKKFDESFPLNLLEIQKRFGF